MMAIKVQNIMECGFLDMHNRCVLYKNECKYLLFPKCRLQCKLRRKYNDVEINFWVKGIELEKKFKVFLNSLLVRLHLSNFCMKNVKLGDFLIEAKIRQWLEHRIHIKPLIDIINKLSNFIYKEFMGEFLEYNDDDDLWLLDVKYKLPYTKNINLITKVIFLNSYNIDVNVWKVQ